MDIRTADPRDASAIAAIYAPIVRETAISFETEPPSVDEVARRVRATLAAFPWLVADEDGWIVGYAYAGPHRERAAYRWSCEASVYVAAPARRQGVATALYGRLFEILRAQNYANVFAGVTLPNDPSLAVHTAVGFREVGVYSRVGFKFGEWRDVAWLGLELRRFGAEPPEPIPFPRLSGV
ncbi:MAG: arsinothricin resistance N-acetyltransferase ArsN1 family B [Pseudomonadota bacterium]